MLWQIGVYLKLLNTILDYFIHKKEEEEQQQHTQKKTKNVNCVMLKTDTIGNATSARNW